MVTQDPHLWQNPRGVWQLLGHFWGKVKVARYAFSHDLITWHVSPVAPYTIRSEREDGSVVRLCTISATALLRSLASADVLAHKMPLVAHQAEQIDRCVICALKY